MAIVSSLQLCDAHTGQRWLLVSAVWALVITSMVVAPTAWAAGIIVINKDHNTRIEVRDARIHGASTTLLYSTKPDRDQPHWSQKCTMNFYLLELQAGLPRAQPRLLAENYCPSGAIIGSLTTRFTTVLLANGDILFNGDDQIETWRPGAGKIKTWSLSDIGLPQGLANSTAIDAARNGKIVLAKRYLRQRNDTRIASGIVMGLSADGSTVWQLKLHEPGVVLNVMDIWASEQGGALLHVTAESMSPGTGIPGIQAPVGAMITRQNRLYRVSAKGKLLAPIVIASMQQQDFSIALPAMPDMAKDPEGYRAAMLGLGALNKFDTYTDGAFLAHALDAGTVDVLMGRSNNQARLLRIDRNGGVMLDISLDETLKQEGLTAWTDFASTQDQLILFGRLGTRKERLNQGFVSWIDIPDGGVITRLAPLSQLGLEAARNSRDAEIKNLEHYPSQQPQMLTSLAGRPLTVSLIYQSRRQALQLDEGTEELAIYTERRDETRARVAKAAQSKQRKANREALQQQLNSDMADAVGMSPEEYTALSNSEQDEAMIRSGDFNAMMAAVTKQQAQIMQEMQAEQAQTGQQARGMPTMPQGMSPEMLAAMANAGITMLGLQGTSDMQGIPPTPAASVAASGITTDSVADPSEPDKILKVDALMRGLIEFNAPDKQLTMLVILDRQTGKVLLKKEFTDGVIYEYIDFNRFNTPLEQIGVLFKDANGRMLKELTPVLLR